MNDTLHITSGDCAGVRLAESGLPGEVFVWHDVLYDGSRNPGWPTDDTFSARSIFLEELTAGGLDRGSILRTLKNQYQKLAGAEDYERIVLWFDACLFDQAMLVHILACMPQHATRKADILCIDTFPGINPFNGLGQLQPFQLASRYDQRRPVTDAQFRFAKLVDKAFADRNLQVLADLSKRAWAPLPWVPVAVTRWLREQPDPITGLGLLERLALQAIRAGCTIPSEIFSFVAESDKPPQFWGDTTLWAKINTLADRKPPLVQIEGPAKRLPQWNSSVDLRSYRITSVPNKLDKGDSS